MRSSVGDKEFVDRILSEAKLNNKKISVKQASILTKNLNFEEIKLRFVEQIGPFLIEKDFRSLILLLEAFAAQQSKFIMLNEILPFYDILKSEQRDQICAQFSESFRDEVLGLIKKINK